MRFLSWFRLTRLLRLVRTFAGVGRALTSLDRFAHHTGLIWLVVGWIAVMLLTATGLFVAENGVNEAVQSPLDALWWGLTTMTTVGYGDVIPTTAEGRVAAAVLDDPRHRPLLGDHGDDHQRPDQRERLERCRGPAPTAVDAARGRPPDRPGIRPCKGFGDRHCIPDDRLVDDDVGAPAPEASDSWISGRVVILPPGGSRPPKGRRGLENRAEVGRASGRRGRDPGSDIGRE